MEAVPAAPEDAADDETIWPEADTSAPLIRPEEEGDLVELESAFAAEVEERRRERLQIA